MELSFGFGLVAEAGLVDADADGPDYRLTDVGRLEVLLEMLLDGLGHGLAEGGEMGTALGGVLAVDEGGYVLPVAVPMGDDALDVLALEMDGRVERLGDHGLVD